jgi:hypothetical protein
MSDTKYDWCDGMSCDVMSSKILDNDWNVN